MILLGIYRFRKQRLKIKRITNKKTYVIVVILIVSMIIIKISDYTYAQRVLVRPINEQSVLIHSFKREQKPSTLCQKERKGKIIYVDF